MHTRGYIDGIFGSAVRGWVVDLDDPANVLQVTIRLDGREFATVAADEPRADLAKAGIGNGRGGFRVHIGTPPVAGTHEIVAVVSGSATAVPLAKDFRLLDEAGAPRTDVELYEGRTKATQRDSIPLRGGEAALAGEAGWLFGCTEPTFDLLRGVVEPDRAELDRLAARVASFQQAAAAQGALCLIAMLPDKLHVYPERAPAAMALYPSGRVAAHLAARVQDTDDGVLLDLLPTLLRARAHGHVFSRAGTGPTWLGAFHAYRAIAKLLALAMAQLRPRPADALLLGDEEPVSDAPDGLLLRWQGQALVPDGSAAGLAATATEPGLSPAFPRNVGSRNEAPVATIIHDAPSRRIARLLGDHCEATLLEHDGADADLRFTDIAAAIVVWVVTDRSLTQLANKPSLPQRTSA